MNIFLARDATSPLSQRKVLVLQPVIGHQSGDTVRTGSLRVIGQELVHPGHAHDAIAGRMGLTDARQEALVVDFPSFLIAAGTL